MEKLTEIKQRLLQFAEQQGLKKEEFYRQIGIDGANFRGKNALSELGSEKIVSILSVFPDLNPDWLMLGKGEMLRSGSPKPASSTPADNDLVLKILAEKDRRIEQLILEKHELEQRLDTVLRVSADIQSVTPPNPLVHR